jgi:hypothetical protein
LTRTFTDFDKIPFAITANSPWRDLRRHRRGAAKYDQGARKRRLAVE